MHLYDRVLYPLRSCVAPHILRHISGSARGGAPGAGPFLCDGRPCFELPFYARAICGFISGESVFRALLIGSIKMGRLLYLKFLALSAVVYALSYLVRLLPYVSETAALYLILTALIFIFLVPVMLIIYRRDRSFSPSESLERDEAQNTGLRLRAERGRAS